MTSKPPTSSGRGDLEKQLDLVVTQAGSKRGKAFLMVSTGEAAGTVFPLTHSSLLIGRSPEAEVRINEQAISHEHARLEMIGARCTIQDLGSTNGTYVNGQRIVQSVVLTGGDTIRAGSTTFTFVTRDVGVPPGTLKLRDPDPQLPIATRASAADGVGRVAIPAAAEQDREEAISLTDVVRTVKAYWVYAKRYGWLASTCLCFGIAVGIAQARLSPPPGSAWFEMTLATETRGNEDDGIQFFVAAESTFRSLPLIKKTLAELGAGVVSDSAASDIQAALTFERAGFNSKLWRGDYKDSTAELAVAFLTKHVDVYVDSELDKILKVLRADAEFDREQANQASRQVDDARARLLAFVDEHPEAVPKDAKVPDQPRAPLGAGASAARISQSIGNVERSLAAARRSMQSKKARPYLDQAAAAESKIADAKARGLRDEHPEIKGWVNSQATMRAKAIQVLNTEPSESEQSLDPDVVRLRQELADLKLRLSQAPDRDDPAVRAATAGTGTAEGKAGGTASQLSLAQLKLKYAELSREYERANTDYEALRKKSEATDRQLDRERTSAEARYDIITPPTPEAKSLAKNMLKRAGLGGAVGLGLALVAAACLELRRILIARGHL
jgi:pSer/pThr/pTyr-binding forkhead associated (FHA) protein